MSFIIVITITFAVILAIKCKRRGGNLFPDKALAKQDFYSQILDEILEKAIIAS
jgi:hypothetical protein